MIAPMLDVALNCISRGWYVFPCIPKTKQPATKDGFKSATLDGAKIREWWGKNPQFNVAIACGASDLCVVDCDYGLDGSPHQLADFTKRLGLAETYAVRTGRRPGYGLQLYLKGAIPDSKFEAHGELASYTGDVKSAGGYVMAAGSIHPSGERYELVADEPLRATPESVRALKRAQPKATLSGKIESDRNSELTRRAGLLRNSGMSEDMLRETLHRMNEVDCTDPLPDAEVDRIADNASRWSLPEEDVTVSIGTASSPVNPNDWRPLFHTRAETEDAPDPRFLIQDFLQEQSITGLIGPARARKSIVVLNLIHALLTGAPLFGKFEVSSKPERCCYLCPESGLLALSRRIRNMGLAPFVGESLFYSSMNSEAVELDDPRIQEAARGSVLFIDTLVRFFGSGEENSATDMKLFFSKCQTLIRSGVRAIVILHHTSKNTDGVRLESGRGSGDFGGSLTAAWATTLDDYEDAFKSHSLLVPVKERDFRAESFKVAPSGDDTNFFLHFVDGSTNARVQVGAKKRAGAAQAAAFARAHPEMTAPQLKEALVEQGILYSERTCRELLKEARALSGKAGAVLTSA